MSKKVVLDFQPLKYFPYSVTSLGGNFEKWNIFEVGHDKNVIEAWKHII